MNWCVKGASEEEWKTFAKNLRVPTRNSRQGPLVRRVLMNVGAKDEFLDMSKDKRGAWRKAKKAHRGQVVYRLVSKTKAGKAIESVKVCPVYVFESAAQVMARLRRDHGDDISIYGFFQSGCMISVETEVPHAKTPLQPGKYLLNSLRTSGDVVVTTQDGKTYPAIPRYSLSAMVRSRLKRAT